jgi:saccharopine dehydrogenase-like NADP-dependent oxidoreductase
LKKVFYIGAGGKIGNAVCKMLVKKGIQVRIFSKYVGFTHDLVSYTQDITEMQQYKAALIGKLMSPKAYRKVLKNRGPLENRYMLDYTVPFMPLKTHKGVHHVQIGVLKVTNDSFLKGYYETGFGIGQGHIYPCHAGCILNLMMKRETDETGEINLDEIEPMWKEAKAYGLVNKVLDCA